MLRKRKESGNDFSKRAARVHKSNLLNKKREGLGFPPQWKNVWDITGSGGAELGSVIYRTGEVRT